MYFAEALTQIAKNIVIKLSADGAAGCCAILGGTFCVSCLAGFGIHEYFEYKTKLAELELQKAMSLLENNERNCDDGNHDGPIPLVRRIDK